MSPVISEQHYKSGMKKDENGFMDIDWCSSTVLNTWDELRETFMAANSKKAIAPTQVLEIVFRSLVCPRYCRVGPTKLVCFIASSYGRCVNLAIRSRCRCSTDDLSLPP